MASACPLVAADTPPVREALVSAEMARFVPFNDVDRIAAELMWCLENPDAAKAMGLRARAEAAGRYDLKILWPAKEAFLRSMT